MQWWRSKAKDASEIELISYDERIRGILSAFEHEGVRKVVSIRPESFFEFNTSLLEEMRQRCQEAAEAAETNSEEAKTQAARAKEYADLAESMIQTLSDLAEVVRLAGQTTEQQGLEAKAVKEEVEDWFSPFKPEAEDWFTNIRQEVSIWFNASVEEWDSWFSERKRLWSEWWSATTSSWSSWYDETRDEWDEWFAARKTQWSTWFSDTRSAYNAWFDAAKSWLSSSTQKVDAWSVKEQERQSAEEIRQEVAAHPPIPSERGYWMFWDVDRHEYVESGYSSRGTMDWPEFFWDYDTMGIGVYTCRDYSRFFIDEEGRFGMYM